MLKVYWQRKDTGWLVPSFTLFSIFLFRVRRDDALWSKQFIDFLTSSTLFENENEWQKTKPVPIPFPRASRNFPNVKTWLYGKPFYIGWSNTG